MNNYAGTKWKAWSQEGCLPGTFEWNVSGPTGLICRNVGHDRAFLIAAAPELLAELEAYHKAVKLAKLAWEARMKPLTKEDQQLIEMDRQYMDNTAALLARAKGMERHDDTD